MSTIRIETQITSDDLLQAVGQLSAPDLERFVAQVLRLEARRKAASLSNRETELLLKINQGLPESLNERYRTLQSKLQAEKLAAEERRELSRLIAQREKLQAQRLEALSELARMWNLTLRGVMKQLGIHSPEIKTYDHNLPSNFSGFPANSSKGASLFVNARRVSVSTLLTGVSTPTFSPARTTAPCK